MTAARPRRPPRNPLQRDGLSRRALPALFAGVGGTAAGLYPYSPKEPIWTIAGLIVGAVMCVCIYLVPWERLPRGIAVTPMLAGCVSLMCMLFGTGSVDVGLIALFLVFIVWWALYGRLWEAGLIAVTAMACILIAAYFNNDIDAGAIAQPLLVWAVVGSFVIYSIHALRSEMAAVIGDREQLIKGAAALDLASTELYSTLNPDEVLSMGLRTAAHLALLASEPVKEAFFFVVEPDEAVLMRHYRNDGDELEEVTFPIEDAPILSRLVDESHCVVFGVGRDSVAPEAMPAITELGITNAVGIGLDCPGLRGVLIVSRHNAEPFAESGLGQLNSFVSIFKSALTRALVHAAEATTDDLTGLANRRGFRQRLESMPRDEHYALISIDVDGLKRLNDTCGHQVGDDLLRLVANTLRRGLRPSDTVARTGGDEFCVLLPHTTAAGAGAVASRMVSEVHAVTIRGAPMSISTGWVVGGPGDDVNERVGAADAAMYAAKRAGANGGAPGGAPGAATAAPDVGARQAAA